MKINVTKPATPQELFEAAERVNAVAGRAETLRDDFYKAADKIRDEVAHSFAGLDMDRNAKAQLIRQTVQKRLADLQKTHLEAADKVLKDIGSDVELMNNSSPAYDAKLKVIGRLTLASPERATFLNNLRDAGPAELANAAGLALQTNNLALVSAITSKLQQMEPSARPFAPNAFADRFNVPEFDRAQSALQILRHKSQVAISAQREIRNPSSRVVGRILNAILKPASESEEE
jgi:hypothetical protein